MSSGIVVAKARLKMELDNVLSSVSALERLIRHEHGSKIDWSRTSATLIDMRLRIDAWRGQLT